MKYFIMLFIIVGACCNTSQPAMQETIQTVPTIIERDKQQDKKDAWRDMVNEKIIVSFEKSDLNVWTFDSERNIILALSREISTSLLIVTEYYSTVSIFDDGTLFLDDLERKMSKAHTERLVNFFIKIKEYYKGKNESK